MDPLGLTNLQGVCQLRAEMSYVTQWLNNSVFVNKAM